MLIVSLLGLFSLTAQAQSAPCTGAAKSTQSEAACAATQASAMALAKESPDIIVKTNETTGTTAFYKKEVNSETGTVTEVPVEYCKKDKAFVQVATSKAACCASAKGATQTSTATKKVVTAKKAPCCASGSSQGCEKGKAANASAREQAKEPNKKLVNSQQ